MTDLLATYCPSVLHMSLSGKLLASLGLAELEF